MFNNTTGEIATALCVTSEAVGEFAHGANQLKIARCDHIGCMFTDTWPTSENELKLLYNMVDGRLGAFHWMRRLTGGAPRRPLRLRRGLFGALFGPFQME